MTSSAKEVDPLLAYDGDCGFCQNVISRISAPSRPAMSAVPWQFLPEETTRPHSDRLNREVLLLQDGRVLAAGAKALAGYMRASPTRLYRIAGTVIVLPGVSQGANVIYRWVARNRHRLPGGMLSCGLPPPPP
ncbi:thiol-disulfide oxidoreductase DCC family protein [Streptomyces kronopolitis]